MARKIGRNDPCPCGSGKKYKHCCRDRDEARRRAETDIGLQSGVRSRTGGHLRAMADLLRHSTPPERAQELQPLLATAEEVASYEDMQDEIEHAAEVLESHRAAFDALLSDPRAATDRAHELFAEEQFRPLRFTAADIQRAFAVVGYPRRPAKWSEDDTEKIIAAIMHLADKEYRLSLDRMWTAAAKRRCKHGH